MKVFITKKVVVSLLFVLGLLGSSWGQVAGDFQPKNATGNWSDFNAWNIRNAANNAWIPAVAGQIPNATTSVYQKANTTITVDVINAECNNLIFPNSTTSKISFNAGTILYLYGNLEFGQITSNIFSTWGAGAKLVCTGSAAQSFSTNLNPVHKFNFLEINKTASSLSFPTQNASFENITLTSGNVIMNSGDLRGSTTATININGGNWTQTTGANRINGGAGNTNLQSININSGTMTLATTSGGTAGYNFSNVNITNGGTLNLNNFTGNINVTNSFNIDASSTLNTALTTTPSATTNSFLGTVNYNHTAAQNVINTTYGNLGLLGGGSKSVTANLNVTRNITIAGTAILPLGTLTANIGGNWTNYGTAGFTEATSTVNFNGSGAQSLTTTGGEDFFKVTKTGTGTLTLNSDVRFSGTGSELNISSGIIDAGVNTLSGTASTALVMSGGVLKLGKLATTLPEFPITPGYNITGGTIELNGAGDQVLRGSRDYVNLSFSTSGIKTLTSSPSSVTGTITVSNSAVLNAASNTLGGTGTNLTMTGTSRYITSGGGTTPDARGTYILGLNTTIEFAGSSNRNIYLTPSYANVDISGSNINLSGTGSVLDMQSGSTFTVKTGGTFNVKNTNGFSGAINTAVGNSNSPTVVLEPNSSINYDGSTQSITNALPYQNIILSGAGTKTAPPAGILTVLGNFTKTNAAAVFNANNGTVAFAGTALQTYSSTGATTFNIVTVNNTSASGLRIDADSMNVENSLIIDAASKLDLGSGYVVLKSTADKTAFVAPVIGGATISYSGVGRFSIERYLFAKKSWRSLATPIDPSDPTTVTQAWRENGSALTSTGYGTQISGPATYVGTDQTTVRGSLKSFDMNLGDFVEVSNMDATPIYNRSGYFVFVRGDRAVSTTGTTGATTLRMKGKLLVGTQTYTVAGDKFLSVGNPFAARIDMKQAIANTRTGGMVEAFTVWNPNSPGSYNVGAYQTYIKDLSTGDYKLNGIGAVNNFVESGQAVFIQAIGATGSFAIGEGDKVSGSSLVSRGEVASRTGVTVPTLDIALNTNDVNGSSFTADATLVNFGNFNDGIDVMDVKKTFNTADNIAIKANNQYLVAERKTMPQANDTIFLHIASLRTTNYSFEINPSLLGGLGLEALLIDRFLGTSTPVSLTDVSTINFTTTADAASKANNRFAIVFKPAAVLPVTFTTITAERDGGSKQIAVKWHVSTELNINRYEVERSATGTNFISLGNTNPTNNTGSAATYVYHDAAPLAATNYYRVKAISNNGAVQYSAVVKVAALPIANGFVVYPNPVVGNTINLQANQVTKGAYSVQLVNATGQIVYKGAINIYSNSQSTSIALDAATAPGKYSLVLVGAEGKVSMGVVVR